MKTRINRWMCVALAAVCCGSITDAQPAARRATSPVALLTYPGFFQGQAVVVRGTLATRDRAVLISPSIERAIPLLFTGTSPADGPVELRATFWDVGRLQRDDPRLANLAPLRLVPNNGEGDWPRPGDVTALIVADATPVKPASGPPTLRLIALDPEAYAGQRVTVTGQFRGRNLFGDLPQAPSVSQWDFVLHNADGAMWVTGVRPPRQGLQPGRGRPRGHTRMASSHRHGTVGPRPGLDRGRAAADPGQARHHLHHGAAAAPGGWPDAPTSSSAIRRTATRSCR